ncbi:MAG: insulinase family protein [Bacteroidales bacterium]|nr:insulinase family protein [Bacteroidales bacterium]
MIEYRKCILDNGLTVLTHEAWDTPLATVNILYAVGSRNEDPQRTGFAHLFEHLMFGGTREVPDFDGVLAGLGGDSNAFTNCDYTNYYMTLPVGGLATALHLEADRMVNLDISQRALEVQQRVVTEEYHQRYMNQPYGDEWLLLRPLCYKVHPYRWATIGADIRHVGEATLDDVRAFHRRWYHPAGAILAVAAPMKHDDQLRLIEKEFGPIGPISHIGSISPINQEPPQQAAREMHVVRQVPATRVVLAYPMCSRMDASFAACDLLTDVLANGKSSRLHRRLVVERGLMSEADAAVTGEADAGLLVLRGTLRDGVDPDEGMAALRDEAMRLTSEGVGEYELQKVQNKFENTFVYSQYRASDRALGLCHYTWLGDTDLVNNEPQAYRRVTAAYLQQAAREVFRPEHENRLYYEAEGQNS